MSIPILGVAKTEADIFAVARAIRDAQPDRLILFRGQTSLYDKLRSGHCRGRREVPEVEVAWSRLAARMLGLPMTNAPETRMSQAILQHYGLPTSFVDLTADPAIAAWFATNTREEQVLNWMGMDLRTFRRVFYKRLNEGQGYVLVLGIPQAHKLEAEHHLFCLSSLPQQVLRPHCQLGWLFFDGEGAKYDLNEYCLGTIAIDRSVYDDDRLSQGALFPPPKDDVAYRELLGFPWVQFPSAYLPPSTKPEEPISAEAEEAFERFCSADRALKVLEYFDDSKQAAYDHKWDDITLYEPHPVRVWRRWNHDLSTRFPQWKGDIAQAVKITLSPRAKSLLEKCEGPLRWPDVESDDIFFSFAQLSHDKVIDYDPPYDGVWLHRDGAWIVETPTRADEDTIGLAAGLVFILSDGALVAKEMKGTCECDNPQSHIERASAMLRLSMLVSQGDITFVPHPLLIPKWYVAV